MAASTELEVLKKAAGLDAFRLQRYIKRRSIGEPLAYIVRGTEFYGRRFYLDRRAFVPCKETEQLVACAIQKARDLRSVTDESKVVIDVGTGCGNIALSVACECEDLAVIGVDISPDALDVAETNVRRLKLNKVELIESDLLLSVSCQSPLLVVADLPYGSFEYLLSSIDPADYAHMPKIALFSETLLGSYQELIRQIHERGWKTTLLFESGVITKNLVAEIIPKQLQWRYIGLQDYSITEVQF